MGSHQPPGTNNIFLPASILDKLLSKETSKMESLGMTKYSRATGKKLKWTLIARWLFMKLNNTKVSA